MNTGNMTTVARPYAIAAFENALAKHAVPAWEGMLSSAAQVAQDAAVKSLLISPKLTSEQLSELFCDVLAKQINEEQANFIKLLSENHRLTALPDIFALFTLYREQHEKLISVQVTSAVELDSHYQQKLAAALTKRLQRKVALQYSVDPELLGGAVIRAGDLVFDGSVRSKLNRLLASL